MEQLEPVLCFALSAAKQRDWQRAHDALRACAGYAEVHRAAACAEYNPESLLERIVRAMDPPVECTGGHTANLAGDAEQIATIARAFLRNAILELDSTLRVSVVELGGVPAWRLAVDGPGRFPESLGFGFDLTLNPATYEAIWTSATRGGRIDTRVGQLELRLKGVRAVLDAPTGCHDIIVPLRELEHRARMLASGEFSSTVDLFVHDGLVQLLAGLDAQDDAPKPCDLSALTRESLPPRDSADPVHFEVVVTSEMPALSIRRNRVVRLLRALRALGAAALTHGGSVRCDIDYAPGQRTANMLVMGEGRADRAAAERYLPTIERAIAVHDGDVEADFAADGFTILLSIPDAIARTLDGWLKGWDTFAPRSIQMLRLLNSGGAVPPEELILNGVLEDELERRLLPRLGVAPAATLIHDLKPRLPALSSSSPQRIEKVCSQLKRRKPKKEICAPAYAAEILWMFSIDQRHANAVGIAEASAPEVTELCRVLSEPPLDLLRALRLLCCVLPLEPRES